MITAADVVLALSNSGETDELLTILPVLKRLDVPLIALTGNGDSTLARYATVTLDVSVPAEACPLNLAPTASTTATLAMGDALAIAVLEARGFTEEDFARSHPGGSLGRRLLLHVEDVMRKGDELPRVGPDTPLSAGLLEMSRKGLGMTTVVDADDRVLGIFTDGDLRRTLDRQVDIHATRMARSHDDEVQGRRAAHAGSRGRAPDGNAPHHVAAGRAVGRRSPAGRCPQRPRPAARGCDVTQRRSGPARSVPRRVRLLVLDVDGVLTDGRLHITANGEETKVFHVRDGSGIVAVQRAGIAVAIISGRDSPAVTRRAAELGIRHVRQGIADKGAALDELLRELQVTAEALACVGDDTPDVPMLERATLAVAVADAHPTARAAAHWTTPAAGGHGAVREVCDLLLTAHGT